MMGGLIDGSTVKGDLWMIESSGGNLSCFPIATVSEGPGPRVGHASLLVGNACIVFGGDTKVDENDALDDTLYLLNTCMSSLFLASGFNLLTNRSYSFSAMVSRHPAWSSTYGKIWSHAEHSWVQTLCIWWSG